MGLQVFWFIAIAVLWTGFLVLEGFDFGVGALQNVVGKDDAERRVVDQHDRAGVGWERGVADRGRRRHLRGVPRRGTRRCSPACTWRCSC